MFKLVTKIGNKEEYNNMTKVKSELKELKIT